MTGARSRYGCRLIRPGAGAMTLGRPPLGAISDPEWIWVPCRWMAEVTGERTASELPEPDAAKEWLQAMMLIRRFEERAGEMYAKAKVGGFLHLAIGEEATIVGAVRAMRDDDFLISTYRSHGHALARGTDPKRVMAELFGREQGVSGGR